MLKHSLKTLTVGGALVLAAAVAWAQTTNTTPTTTPVPETKIGVSPQDAKEAAEKAVPNAETGTLVRTAPSAAERASEMTKDAKKAVKGDKADKRRTATPKQPTPGPTTADPEKPVINPAPTAKP